MEEDNDGDDFEIEVPFFLCQHNGHAAELHSHTFADDVLYHIGWYAFTSHRSHNLQLTSDSRQQGPGTPGQWRHCLNSRFQAVN
jgi:hypothetical protein